MRRQTKVCLPVVLEMWGGISMQGPSATSVPALTGRGCGETGNLLLYIYSTRKWCAKSGIWSCPKPTIPVVCGASAVQTQH